METSNILHLIPLLKKLLKERNILGRRYLLILLKRLCVLQIERRILLKIPPEEEVVKEEVEEEILEAGGADTLKEKSHIYVAYVAKEMDHMMHPHASCLGIELSRKEANPKVKLMTKRKVNHLNTLTILWHNVILE